MTGFTTYGPWPTSSAQLVGEQGAEVFDAEDAGAGGQGVVGEVHVDLGLARAQPATRAACTVCAAVPWPWAVGWVWASCLIWASRASQRAECVGVDSRGVECLVVAVEAQAGVEWLDRCP